MDDKKKIKMLEARNESLQKTIDQLTKPPEITRVYVKKITFEEALKGFDYPGDTKHIWVDYRDGGVLLILPVKQADNVKSPKAEGTG